MTRSPTGSAAASFRNPRSLLHLGVLLAVVLVLVVSLATLRHLRDEAENRAALTTQNLAQSLELTIEGMIDTIDLALLGAADEISRQIASGRPDRSEISAFLSRQKQRLPKVFELRATNAAGDVVYANDGGPTNINCADRDYFIRPRDDRQSGLFIAKPLLGRLSNEWVWVFARRINTPQGEFAGVVFSTIRVDTLTRMLSQIKLDPGSIALRDADWALITRFPQNPRAVIGVGNRQLSQPFAAAIQANPREGTYISGPTSIDGIDRTYSYRRSDKYRFVVNVGIPLEATLLEWRQQVGVVAGLAGSLIVALLVFTTLISRAWRRQEQDMAALDASRQELDEAQEIAGIGRYSYDLVADRWQSSAILDGIFGIGSDYPRDVAHWLDFVASECREEMQAHLRSVIEQRGLFDHEYRIIRPADGDERWVHGKGKLKLDAQGRPVLLAGTIQDITQRKRVAAEVLAAKQQLQATLDAIPDLLFELDEDGRILDYRSPRHDLLAAPPAMFLGSFFGDVLPPDAAEACRAALREAQEKGHSIGCQYELPLAQGELSFELSVARKPGSDGKGAGYIALARDITSRRAAEEQIRHLAFYDPLTQLPNRRLMLDRLEQALASCARHLRHGALMLIDMDNFKTLNDTLGHDVGDQLLVMVAVRLESCVREGDTVARLGGDEFVVILEELDTTGLAAMQAESVVHKILRKLAEPYVLDLGLPGSQVEQRSHHCSSSIGITLFREHPVGVDELMKRADTAMYQAKAAGRNTLRFFDPEMQAAVNARAEMDRDLRSALAGQQFRLYYQAQFDSAGAIIGAEALLRWLHPERGMVAPSTFIPACEESGMILPLGQWVLETACRQLAVWAATPASERLTLAVNVSARQFRCANFVEQVLLALEHSGARPERLKLELTESLLVEDVDEVIAKMTALKSRGVGFSLDDFGTGYSSLAYLKRLPIGELKIDCSFVHDVHTNANDAAISRTIVALGHTLGFSIIAEGVETEAQREFLARIGCHAYQGALFGKALPVAEFDELVRRHAHAAAARV